MDILELGRWLAELEDVEVNFSAEGNADIYWENLRMICEPKDLRNRLGLIKKLKAAEARFD